MSENKKDPSSISDAVNAVANLAKAVPIYDDALQPIMKETGKALSTVGRAVNVALAPIKGFVWGAEQIEEWLATRVTKKLEDTPAEDIQTPDLAIAGPTIEALKFNGHKSELSDMLAGLLAGAMKKDTLESAHPSFVEIIKSMTSLDARLFAFISKQDALPTMDISRKDKNSDGITPVVIHLHPHFLKIAGELGVARKNQIATIRASVENLGRLGLIEISSFGYLTDKPNQDQYSTMKNGPVFADFTKSAIGRDYEYQFDKSFLAVTQFGRNLSKLAL